MKAGWKDAEERRGTGGDEARAGRDRREPRDGADAERQEPVGFRERRLAKFRQNVARFRLYRHRFLQVNMRFAAFFKIYQII